MNRRLPLFALFVIGLSGFVRLRGGTVIHADPSNYRSLLGNLKPGDTLSLEPGKYLRLPITNLNGTPGAWITITGPQDGPPAVIVGSAQPGGNIVEILNSSYVAIENLRIDSLGIPGVFGISAKGRGVNATHHIRIEGNTLVGQNGGQQTDGISTKTPTWGWVIRYNQILGAGTGIYLGDSDGNQPFVNGLIENNLIRDTIGYNMEIKDQNAIPDMPGMPMGPTSTIIRNNVFIKNDQPSPDGDRPSLLVGAVPPIGTGSLNLYEIYGNSFLHNHREALFQGSGRVSLHDNIFVDGPYGYAAVLLQKQNYPLKTAVVYNNTVYTSGVGISLSKAELYDAVVGNLVFGTTPISGQIMKQADNIVDSPEKASAYVKAPALDGPMDFFPLAGKCQGRALDLSDFYTDADYSLDFNGLSKIAAKGAVVYRGAYADDRRNLGWELQPTLKAPAPPALKHLPALVWLTPSSAKAGSTIELTVTGAAFAPDATVAVSGSGVEVTDAKVEGATRIEAKVKISSSATPGARDVTVTTPSGGSNTIPLRIIAGTKAKL